MYSKLIYYSFLKKEFSFFFLFTSKQRRKVSKNTTNIRFFSISMREKEIFLDQKTEDRGQCSSNSLIIEH